MPAGVLVVAAQPAIQLDLGNMLRRDGQKITFSSDARDGMRRWAADRPELVAIDSDLPGPTGLELVGSAGAELRQMELTGSR